MAQEMTGRICLVTGASSGVGRQAARELAALGATVVMVCRNRELGEKTRTGILRATGNDRAALLLCDLSSQKQIRALAAEFRSRFGKLHVLVNNAAIVPARRLLAEDGIEMQLAVNHIAYFLLTDLLLDALRDGAPARILNVASGMHWSAHLDFDNLQAGTGYKPMRQYAVTKLLNIHFTYELARRLEGSQITVNALSPGFTSTRISREFPPLSRIMVKILAKNVHKGVRTVTYLASSPEVEGVTGMYFEDCRQKATSPQTHDPEVAARVWEETEKLIFG